MLRDLALALSLSNLSFISAWRLLLIPSSFFIYHHKDPRPVVDYVALILDVMVLATLFFITIVLARRSKYKSVRTATKVGFILILSVPLHGLLSQIDNSTVRHFLLPLLEDEVVARRILFTVPLTLSVFIVLIGLLRMDRAVRIASGLVLILMPLLPLSIVQAIVTATKGTPHKIERAAATIAHVPDRGRLRVVWLVFDELDYRTAFENRPPDMRLPELDRLASESLFAENAFPPAGETFLTMPALITGRLVSDARRKGGDELMIQFGDESDLTAWSAQPNIFSRAREAGFNTALVGWYHPYCTILGNNLTKCAWEDGLLPHSEGLTPYMYTHALQAAQTPPFASFIFRPKVELGARLRKKHISDLDSMYKHAIDFATDRDISVVMVHWPIPHHPNIYDRANNSISEAAGRSYLDNLALVDRTVGDFRRMMEASGAWDESAVLITSDHWWRGRAIWKKFKSWTAEDEKASAGVVDHRVPFILKLPGSGQPTKFSQPFNTVLTHDLMLAILRGEVSDPGAAAAWLDRHRSIGRSPYDERSSRSAE